MFLFSGVPGNLMTTLTGVMLHAFSVADVGIKFIEAFQG